MRLVVLLVFIFFSALVNGQEIYYTYQDISLQEIEQSEINWKTYKKPIYEGLNNGVYWFKIKLNDDDPQVLNIPNCHITKANLYVDGLEIEKHKYSRYVTFDLPNDKTNKTFFLKVNCLLEASIPIKIQNYKTYNKKELYAYILIGLYVGIVICIFLFNLISYFSFRDINYIYYILFSFGLTVNVLYKDGVSAALFGIEGIHEFLLLPLNSIFIYNSIIFCSSFLSLRIYFPRVIKLEIVVIILSNITCITYLITGSFTFFIITVILYLLCCNIILFTAVLLWNKSSYAKLFVIAYGLLLIAAHYFFLCPLFGVGGLGLPLYYFKIASIFEMLVFTYAILYRSKKIVIENEEVRKKIEEFTDKLKSNQLEKTQGVSDELITEYNFTIREIEILKLVADKKRNKEIANELFVSESTVKFHIRNILQKLEVKNRKEASEKYLNFNVAK